MLVNEAKVVNLGKLSSPQQATVHFHFLS